MAVALRHSRRFDASSPVTRYWLANCVGFSVAGGGRGVVEAVHAGPSDPHSPQEIVVRRGRRTRTVPVSAVSAVVPSDRLLVVEHAPRRVELQGARAARAAGHGTSLLGRATLRLLAWLLVRGRRLGLGAWRHGRRGWAGASPVVAAAARAARADGRRLIASVPWQRFGPSVRSGTTNLWQAVSRISSRLRTTWSRRRSGSDSARGANTTSST